MNTPALTNTSFNTNPEENFSKNTQYFKNHEIKLATLNIDTNLLLETAFNKVFPEYTVANRMVGIIKKLKDFQAQNVDIICIQEGRKCAEKNISINSVDPIIKHLIANNYSCEKIHYNNSGDKAFQYITALNTDKFNIVESKRTLLSQDGKEYSLIKTDAEIKQLSDADKQTYYQALKHHYFDQVHPRSIFITEAIHKETAQQIFVANLHLGVFPESHKTKSINFVIQHIQKLQQEHPESIIFLAGDFNSFADQQGTQQIELLHQANFIDLSANIKHPDGNNFAFNSTFVAYPYDYAAYNADPEVKQQLAQIKTDINKTNDTETKSTVDYQLEDIRNNMISIFDDCQLKAETSSNSKNSALYPLTGQLDHLFVTTKKAIILDHTSIVQICDMNGNIIKNSREDIITHIKNSLKNKQPSFPTDHQGLISKILLPVKVEAEK